MWPYQQPYREPAAAPVRGVLPGMSAGSCQQNPMHPLYYQAPPSAESVAQNLAQAAEEWARMQAPPPASLAVQNFFQPPPVTVSQGQPYYQQPPPGYPLPYHHPPPQYRAPYSQQEAAGREEPAPRPPWGASLLPLPVAASTNLPPPSHDSQQFRPVYPPHAMAPYAGFWKMPQAPLNAGPVAPPGFHVGPPPHPYDHPHFNGLPANQYAGDGYGRGPWSGPPVHQHSQSNAQPSGGYGGREHHAEPVVEPYYEGQSDYGQPEAEEQYYDESSATYQNFDFESLAQSHSAEAIKKLPPWIREGLAKLEREKQKEREKQRFMHKYESQVKEETGLVGGSLSSRSGSPPSRSGSRARSGSAVSMRSVSRSPSPLTSTERHALILQATKEMVTSILMASTSRVFEKAALEEVESRKVALRQATTKPVKKSAALAALAQFGSSDSDSDADGEKHPSGLPPPPPGVLKKVLPKAVPQEVPVPMTIPSPPQRKFPSPVLSRSPRRRLSRSSSSCERDRGRKRETIKQSKFPQLQRTRIESINSDGILHKSKSRTGDMSRISAGRGSSADRTKGKSSRRTKSPAPKAEEKAFRSKSSQDNGAGRSISKRTSPTSNKVQKPGPALKSSRRSPSPESSSKRRRSPSREKRKEPSSHKKDAEARGLKKVADDPKRTPKDERGKPEESKPGGKDLEDGKKKEEERNSIRRRVSPPPAKPRPKMQSVIQRPTPSSSSAASTSPAQSAGRERKRYT